MTVTTLLLNVVYNVILTLTVSLVHATWTHLGRQFPTPTPIAQLLNVH
jgi:hypothetical protein